MTIKTLALLAVVALATAACAQEQEAESRSATSAYLPTTGPPAAVSVLDTMLLRNDADVAAMRVARDLHITDPALLTRIRNEYYARGRTLQGYAAQYAADTTGAAAAVRATNAQTTRRLQTAFTPGQYQAYARHQTAYYAPVPPAAVAPVATRPVAVAVPGAVKSSVTKGRYRAPGSKVTFQKVKYANGVKVKRNFDGSLKIKRADGTIVKFDKNGKRTVKKSLF
ncbi:hypothetical protein [Hymenobacter coccineus]|uniref:PBCV-specific basic adaptor domain-containing protein n=1 Tax=Hymenobacter coccineus TaxID=1908235 RepID=A0A1G1TIY4_9BACT|nr:hypothetical protein [Hymenobacter coccineus]OGX90832.1 hypothetical protein BEN49_00645 [Hymenobacter coccineus]